MASMRLSAARTSAGGRSRPASAAVPQRSSQTSTRASSAPPPGAASRPRDPRRGPPAGSPRATGRWSARGAPDDRGFHCRRCASLRPVTLSVMIRAFTRSIRRRRARPWSAATAPGRTRRQAARRRPGWSASARPPLVAYMLGQMRVGPGGDLGAAAAVQLSDRRELTGCRPGGQPPPGAEHADQASSESVVSPSADAFPANPASTGPGAKPSSSPPPANPPTDAGGPGWPPGLLALPRPPPAASSLSASHSASSSWALHIPWCPGTVPEQLACRIRLSVLSPN